MRHQQLWASHGYGVTTNTMLTLADETCSTTLPLIAPPHPAPATAAKRQHPPCSLVHIFLVCLCHAEHLLPGARVQHSKRLATHSIHKRSADEQLQAGPNTSSAAVVSGAAAARVDGSKRSPAGQLVIQILAISVELVLRKLGDFGCIVQAMQPARRVPVWRNRRNGAAAWPPTGSASCGEIGPPRPPKTLQGLTWLGTLARRFLPFCPLPAAAWAGTASAGALQGAGASGFGADQRPGCPWQRISVGLWQVGEFRHGLKPTDTHMAPGMTLLSSFLISDAVNNRGW
jgi:hypothetical protein